MRTARTAGNVPPRLPRRLQAVLAAGLPRGTGRLPDVTGSAAQIWIGWFGEKAFFSATPSPSAGGAALLFQTIKGYPGSQVLINQFGSARRMNLALGVNSLDEVADRIRAFIDVKSPQGFLDKVKMLPMLGEMAKFFPKTVSTGPCKEVIKRDNFSVLDFPIL